MEADYKVLATSWITPELADAAMLRRVDAQQGRELLGQKGKRDCAGIVIPYYFPGETSPVAYRLRLDHPEMREGSDGKLKAAGKYLAPKGDRNRLYIPPGVTVEQLNDISIPIVLVEGEEKALALWRRANDGVDAPRFIPIAIPGVWSWLGKVGRAPGPNGEWLDVKGPIADLSRVLWKGRKIFIVFDSNVHTNDSVKWARKGLCRELAQRGADVNFVNLPEDCGVNGVDDLLALWGPERVIDLFEAATSGAHLRIVPPVQFRSGAEGMFRISQSGDRLSQSRLTNFTAKITTNIEVDDGVESYREMEIEAEIFGRKKVFTIAASEFAKMNWAIEQLGGSAITFTNQKENARVAIQSESFGATEKRIYSHTGWRKIDDVWMFLHASGAIGAGGPIDHVHVRLHGALSKFELVSPRAIGDLVEAFHASLRLLKVGPPILTFPLFAATFRPILGASDFSLHLAGATGGFKTELVALFQQHFGPAMNSRNLPSSWSSTPNSIEALAFYAKDALLVIDDFAPQGSSSDIARLHAAADRIFRAVGNHSGRGRLESNARLREVKPPRALIFSTGEDIPRGLSIRARLQILEVAKGDINKDILTACQNQSRLYALTMAGFIQWLAGRYDESIRLFNEKRLAYRARVLADAAHARTPEIIANLQCAFDLVMEFGVAIKAISIADAGTLMEKCSEALCQVADMQEKHQGEIEPTARFMRLLHSVLSSGHAHLEIETAVRRNSQQRADGERIRLTN